MKKSLFLLVAVSFLITGCVSLNRYNPYNLPAGKGAHLKNRKVSRGKARYSFRFLSAGGRSLTNTFVVNPYGVAYRIPSGEITLKLKIVYIPNASVIGSFKNFTKEYSYEIYVFENIEKPLRLNALEGHVYQINCKVESGKAYIWIEDSGGERVTDIKVGYGRDYSEIFIWETLPPPLP